MPAALVVEAIITGANQFTAATSFRGRVNVYVEDTATPWVGWVQLQRRYQKADSTFTNWETIEAYNQPGTSIFVEHEDGVQYRLGVPTGEALTGGTPYVRISQ
jgi:hypothetical protein